MANLTRAEFLSRGAALAASLGMGHLPASAQRSAGGRTMHPKEA